MKNFNLSNYHTIDLTHLLTPTIPTWDGSCGFFCEVKSDYDQQFRTHKITMPGAGIGTHIDAPSHCIPGGVCIDDIPFEKLVCPACVIDVSSKADQDYLISIQDIKAFEKVYGPIPKNSLAIGYTGWDRYWSDKNRYRNVNKDSRMHFPAFSAEAAAYLVDRDVAGIGIDTLSPDCLDTNFSVHKIILGAGKYIIENMAEVSQLPKTGATVIVLPLKISGGAEAPIRALGFFI